MCQSDIKMEVNTDIQMQPLDLSCPKRSSHYYEDEEPTNLVLTPRNGVSTTVVDIDRPHSAESDSDSERPTNLTVVGNFKFNGLEFGPARKRFLTKYFNKDLPGN